MARSIPRCEICRQDKKKCEGRPGQKCDRCTRMRLSCSEYRTTEEERRSRNGPQPTQRLPSPMPSTIGENPLFQECLLLLSYGRMLFHVESVANDISAKMRTKNCGSFVKPELPEIVSEIEDCSGEIATRLLLLARDIDCLNNVSDRVELSSAIQTRIEAHPNLERLRPCLDYLHSMTATAIGMESRRLYDAEHSLADIEREVENVINVPILYSKKESNGQSAKTFIRSLESLEKRFSPILGGNWDALFNNEVKGPIPSLLRHDSLRRTPLHFAIEKMLFEPGPRLPRSLLIWIQAQHRDHHPSWQIDAQDAFGRTVLHIACDHGNYAQVDVRLRIISTLLARGARIDVVDKYGKRAIDYAIIHHNTLILEIFKIQGRLNLNGINSAMGQVKNAMNSVLDASRIACQRPGNEIEMDTMDE